MRGLRVDGSEYAWGPRGSYIVLKTPERHRLRVHPEKLSPPGAAPIGDPREVRSRHVRWYILAVLMEQPARADREARRQAKRERKARRRQAPPPPSAVARGLRDVHIVIGEKGVGARYSWRLVGVYDSPERARAIADGRNRETYAAMRRLDPMLPPCKPGELCEIIERRDPEAWRYRVEQRLANHDPVVETVPPGLAAE